MSDSKPATALRPFRVNLFQLPHQLSRRDFRPDAAHPADPKEFHHVQPTFAQFQTADEIPFTLKFRCELPLRQPGLATQLD